MQMVQVYLNMKRTLDRHGGICTDVSECRDELMNGKI